MIFQGFYLTLWGLFLCFLETFSGLLVKFSEHIEIFLKFFLVLSCIAFETLRDCLRNVFVYFSDPWEFLQQSLRFFRVLRDFSRHKSEVIRYLEFFRKFFENLSDSVQGFVGFYRYVGTIFFKSFSRIAFRTFRDYFRNSPDYFGDL